MGQSCFYFEPLTSLFLGTFSHWIEGFDLKDTHFAFYDCQCLNISINIESEELKARDGGWQL